MEAYVCVEIQCMHLIFLYLFVCHGHLGLFHAWALVNNDAIDVEVQMVRDGDLNFFGYIHRSWIARSYGCSIFNFLRNLHFSTAVG